MIFCIKVCRFLQQNAIHDLSGLHCLPELEVLNISTNHLEDLSGIVHCSALQTLLCSNNKLSSYESIAHIRHCQQISTLDLRENEIEDPKVRQTVTTTLQATQVLAIDAWGRLRTLLQFFNWWSW